MDGRTRGSPRAVSDGKLECATLFARNRKNHSTQATLAITESTAERYTLADPDVRLMLLVRDDDPRAFEELMLRYQNRLVSLLAHLTGQRDIAEDLAQDVFLRVYRARKRYVPGAKFSTWLFTIAGNVAANCAAEPRPAARSQFAAVDERHVDAADRRRWPSPRAG